MTQSDIWRTADLLIRTEGEDANLVAENLALAWTQEGNADRAFTWFSIARAIETFLRSEPAEGEAVH